MAIFMVGLIKRQNDLIGVRLIDTDTKSIRDMSVDSVISAIKSGVFIDNLELDGSKLKGVNGDIHRYGVVDVSQSCTILGVIKDDRGETAGYLLSDTNGNIKDATVDETISLVKRLGLANGKLCERNGKYYISPISGEYEAIKGCKQPASNKDIIKQRFIDYASSEFISTDFYLVITGKHGNYKMHLYDMKIDSGKEIAHVENCFGCAKDGDKLYAFVTLPTKGKEALIQIWKIDKYSHGIIEEFTMGKLSGHFIVKTERNCALILYADSKDSFYTYAKVVDLQDKDKSGVDIRIDLGGLSDSYVIDGKTLRIFPPKYRVVKGSQKCYIQLGIESFSITRERVICDFCWKYVDENRCNVIKIDDCDRIGARYVYDWTGNSRCRSRFRG